MKLGWIILLLLLCNQLYAAYSPAKLDDSQMVSLNIQMKAKNKLVSSNLTMPFYQSAEFEKKIEDRNYFFVLNPKKGENPSEVEIEVKLYNKAQTKVIAKKDITTKLNQETVVSMKGVMFKIMPTI